MYFPLPLLNCGQTPLPPKWINQQSSYRAIYRCRIAILQAPYSFIEGAAQKSPRGLEWVRLRTDFQSRAN
jgi:hypothetical protein